MASNGKTETTIAMENILTSQLFHNEYCLLHKEVFYEANRATINAKCQRCDLMGFSKQNRQLICIELKQSVSDFHSNAELTFIGNRNYYAMPYDIYEKVKDEISKEIGVFTLPRDLILKQDCEMYLIKPCKHKNGLFWNSELNRIDYETLIEIYWEMQNSVKANRGILGDSLLNLDNYKERNEFIESIRCMKERN